MTMDKSAIIILIQQNHSVNTVTVSSSVVCLEIVNCFVSARYRRGRDGRGRCLLQQIAAAISRINLIL